MWSTTSKSTGIGPYHFTAHAACVSTQVIGFEETIPIIQITITINSIFSHQITVFGTFQNNNFYGKMQLGK